MSYPRSVVAYHTGTRNILEDVINRGVLLKWSTLDREWLGHGVYFWHNLAHANRWRAIGFELGWWTGRGDVAILKADIKLGNCLDLTIPSGTQALVEASEDLKSICDRAGKPYPVNARHIDGLPVERRLDCAIVNLALYKNEVVHGRPFDTVYGAFEDGEPVFAGSTFRRNTHIQISVRNHSCIKDPVLV